MNCKRCMAGMALPILAAAVLLAAWPVWASENAAGNGANDTAPGRALARKAAQRPELWITADHSQHEILKQPFETGPAVTAACLSCHNQAGVQFHKTIHWTWLDPHEDPAKGIGKGGMITNNFCINIQSNEPRCTSCHAGYGWKDTATFDFTDPTRIDCLVCHEQTGTYKKFPAGAGNPVPKETVFPGNGKTYYPPDWNKVAQSVGRPTRSNCGTCHFFGGGGDGVKHGDLDSSLFKPNKTLDVHMGVDGQDFDCVRCHTTVGHDIAGRIYSNPAATERKSLLEDDLIPRITCESCHSASPHKTNAKANDHTDKVACQSCHIPEFARAKPTKMSWDWSTAGQKKDGKPFTKDGPFGKHSYDTKKGDFVWEMNVEPEYYWFNGVIESVRATDIIDDSGVVKLAWPEGSPGDPRSRIMPFKVHRGKTPYDKVNKTMVVPHLFGKDPDAYWKGYDWGKAIAAGMAKAGLEYSGEYGFVETEWVYPTTHMVAPKDNRVECGECHSRNGRLAGIQGVYMPGRDYNAALNWVGWAGTLAALIGVAIHGLVRIFAGNKRKED